MWTEHCLIKKNEDPEVTLRLPQKLYLDLKSRAKVLGRSVDVELKLRLIRTLEHDRARDQSDELLEAIFYNAEEA